MKKAKIVPSNQGDARYYKRALNLSWIWNLQHKPRRQIIETFMEIMKPKETDLVLDLGTAALPEPLENIFECHYPFKHRITAVGTEDCGFLEAQYPGLRFVRVMPKAKLPFDDKAFDIGFSNATIEHVGARSMQSAFLSELVRVSHRVFLATPNRWFPIELHTRLPLVHWLPPSMFRAIISKMGFTFYAQEENLNLLTAHDLVHIVPQAHQRGIRLRRNYFLGIPSNLVLIIE